MNTTLNTLLIKSMLPCPERQGKIKIKKTFIDFYKAIDDGKIWISNGNKVIGYPITEYEPAETCWLYITANGVSIYPVEKTPNPIDDLIACGNKIIDDMFGDILNMVENIK